MVPLEVTFGLVFVCFLGFAFLAPLALYALVRSEHDQRTELSRSDGERVARRDSRDERR